MIAAWWDKISGLLVRYERHISVVSVIGGFSFDLMLAKRPDSVLDNLLLLFYLCLAAGIIMALNRRKQLGMTVAPMAIFVLQFCLGGLSSNMLVLYGHSGTQSGNFLFLFFLVGMLVGNEFFKTRYEMARFNIAIYYILLLTYCVIAVPTFLVHKIGAMAFLASGGVSLAIMALFFFGLSVVTTLFKGREGKKALFQMSSIIGGIFLFFNLLYFTQVIPPVPLALKDIGIYHTFSKVADGVYEGTYEATNWEFWKSTSSTYTTVQGGSATCFSSVFAPSGLGAPIRHRWERYDTKNKAWITTALVPFSINGGRAEGYRGFTTKSSLTPGAWRCTVETQSGQEIGQFDFAVVSTSTPLTNLSAREL